MVFYSQNILKLAIELVNPEKCYFQPYLGISFWVNEALI